jgi:hypothetical protein
MAPKQAIPTAGNTASSSFNQANQGNTSAGGGSGNTTTNGATNGAVGGSADANGATTQISREEQQLQLIVQGITPATDQRRQEALAELEFNYHSDSTVVRVPVGSSSAGARGGGGVSFGGGETIGQNGSGGSGDGGASRGGDGRTGARAANG